MKANGENKKAPMKDCSCEECVRACHRRPGWFAPGEAEAVAARLGKSIDSMLGRELTIDWWEESDGPNTYLLMPNTVGSTKRIQGTWPDNGTCVFLRDGLCTIHDIKPYECRHAMPCLSSDQRNWHKETAALWRRRKHQARMRALVDESDGR